MKRVIFYVDGQNMLMNCNKAVNGDRLKIHYGKYQDKTMTCRASEGCGKDFLLPLKLVKNYFKI